MQDFFQRVDEIVDKLKTVEKARIETGKLLREIGEKINVGPDSEIDDYKLINKVIAKPIEKNVMGIDGGIVKTSLHGLDLLLLRAIGVNFLFSNGKISEVKYYPNSSPTPCPKMILDTFSEFELNSCFNFERQVMEIEMAIEAMENLNPDIVLFDGSIIPHYVPKPDSPSLKEHYSKLIETYKNLYQLSRRSGIAIAGVIEDSRGTKFCDIINRRLLPLLKDELKPKLKLVLEKTKDTNLLYYALEKGERTCSFNYSENPALHPLLKEFNSMSDSFFSFYLKTVEFDRPIRIDFFSNGKVNAEGISNVILQMTAHSGYGIPSVIIEADQRAKLSQKDIELFYYDLINKIGNVSSLFRMRRNMRPF